jgi:hypothetical protein
MFACLLLAAALGGVAAANPGVWSIGDQPDAIAGVAAPDHSGGARGPDANKAGAGVKGADGRTRSQSGPDAQGPSDAHTTADCAAAFAPASTGLPPAHDATGTASAIYTLLAHCEANLSAPGSLNSLDQVVQTFVRHHEHGRAGGSGTDNGGVPGGDNGNGNGDGSNGNGNGGGSNGNAGGTVGGGSHQPPGGQAGGHPGGNRPQTSGGGPSQPTGGGVGGNDDSSNEGDRRAVSDRGPTAAGDGQTSNGQTSNHLITATSVAESLSL